ncbi:MAG: HAD-IA family hydrolase [Elusimicrobia bacterium]|nr:HAD-IA family hydrolase [Elusimicrobiota bacterium]
MIKVLFFDFDGVIAESVDIKTRAFARLFETEESDVVRKIVDYHSKNTGVSRFDKFRYFYKHFLHRHLPDAEFQSLCKRFSKLVIDEVVNAPYVKGADEFLRKYAHQYLCFIVSATPQQEMEEILRKKDILRYFKRVYGSPTTKKDAVRITLQEERIVPEDSLYVGDARSDYEAAKESRVHFAALVSQKDTIFNRIDCVKLNDLVHFEKEIKKL